MTEHPFATEVPMGAPLPPEAAAHSGLEQIQLQIAGEWSPPPIHYLTGMLVRAAESGSATFAMPVTDWWRIESGIDWHALAAFVIDAPLGVAVLTTLPAGRASTRVFDVPIVVPGSSGRPVVHAVSTLRVSGGGVVGD